MICYIQNMETSEKLALASILVNLFLVGLKYGLAKVSGSLALVADAIHSLSDVVASGTILIGIKISKRRSSIFPYGLYKVENLISLVVAFLIFGAGFEIVKHAFTRGGVTYLHQIPVAIIGVCLTIVITYLFSRYEYKKGQEIGSPSIVADAQHIKTDMLSSLAILVGLIGESFGIGLDRVVALLVAVLIGKAGLEIFVDSIKVLLDASVDFTTLDKVKEIVLSEPRVAKVKTIWGRSSGRYKFIELVTALNVHDFKKAHLISEQIEQRIKQEIPHVDHILIHYEPISKNSLVYSAPLDTDKIAVSEHFGDAPYFYFIKLRKDNYILEEKIISNPYATEKKGKGIKVGEWLIKNGVDIVVSRQKLEGRGPFYVLSDAGIEIITTRHKTITDIKQALVKGDLIKKETNRD